MKTACALALLTTALAGCGDGSAAMLHDDGGDGYDFTIGGMPLHVGSATARTINGVLGFYFTDQPDACLAVTQQAVGAVAILGLRVNPQADGTLRATVVPTLVSPAPGQAMGQLLFQVGGTTTKTFPATSGSLYWTSNTDGSYTVVNLDVGFAGAAERVGLAAIQMPVCP